MLVSLTVGKVDAGVAVLLTEDKRLIEFPSILLPPDIHSGSIVDINVSRNHPAEEDADQKFSALQDEIFSSFGISAPKAPVLRCRNATQTSVVLEWDPIELAKAELRSLSLYRNGTKAGVIPKDKMSTKISGLGLDQEYTFHLVLRTSAGMFQSEKVVVRTHKMTDLTGITVTPGVMPSQLKESLAETINKMGAKLNETVRIDTTHFVCTEPRGEGWEKAVEMNLPVVVPDWVKGCEREGKVVGVRGYYLGEDPKLRSMGPSQSQQVQAAQRLSTGMVQGSPRIEHTPPTPERSTQDEDRGASRQSQGQRGASERLAEERAGSVDEDGASESGRERDRAAIAKETEVNESDEDEDDDEPAPHETRSETTLPERPAHQQTPSSARNDEEDESESEVDGQADTGDGKSDKFDEVAL